MSKGKETVRVAIIGARGIGRHHANWWQTEGHEIRAIAGTSAETAEQARARLAEMFGFGGRVYADAAELLAREEVDWVDICSPPAVHAEHVRAALQAGRHVLCEKPFLYDPSQPVDTLLRETRQLLDMARDRGRRLALCSQFSVAATWSAAQLGPGFALQDFEGRLASPAKGRAPDAVRVWGDLGPHMLAAVQALAPDGTLEPGSVKADFSEGAARCEFWLQTPNRAQNIRCRIHVHNTEGEPANIRRIVLNGTSFDFEGAKGPDGLFGLRAVTSDGRTLDREDTMRELIRLTAQGRSPLTDQAVQRNEVWLLQLAAAAKALPGSQHTW